MARPLSELDVVFFIGRYWDELVSETPLEEIEFHDGSLDAEGLFDSEEVMIEVEKKGSDFFTHGHDEQDCDLVICWTNDRTKQGVGSIESREWKTRSDNPDPAFEDIGIDVIELSEMEVYWSN